jgi:hypothetical protein
MVYPSIITAHRIIKDSRMEVKHWVDSDYHPDWVMDTAQECVENEISRCKINIDLLSTELEEKLREAILEHAVSENIIVWREDDDMEETYRWLERQLW